MFEAGLVKLGSDAAILLQTYIATFGAENVYIVTNSGEGWIQQSLQPLSWAQMTLAPSSRDHWAQISDILFASPEFDMSERIISANHYFKTANPDLYDPDDTEQHVLWKLDVFMGITAIHLGDDTKK